MPLSTRCKPTILPPRWDRAYTTFTPPAIPGVEEIAAAIHARLEKIDREQLWINPDCGLKTRGLEETLPSLQNLVAAAKQMRKELGHGGETL
jgi:methionine synthase (B12-independent) (EC 2.1.1.14)